MSASLLCAVHCAALPFAIAMLPLVGLHFLAHPAFEASMIGVSVVVGGLSLMPSYFRVHRKLQALLVLASGFGLIVFGHFVVAKQFEPLVVPMGALGVAAAHFLNYRMTQRCVHCHEHVCDNPEHQHHDHHAH